VVSLRRFGVETKQTQSSLAQRGYSSKHPSDGRKNGLRVFTERRTGGSGWGGERLLALRSCEKNRRIKENGMAISENGRVKSKGAKELRRANHSKKLWKDFI
jgi:hypothetical protein